MAQMGGAGISTMAIAEYAGPQFPTAVVERMRVFIHKEKIGRLGGFRFPRECQHFTLRARQK